jgi:NAD(P)-dependent dehydrogenase (short-subunit alcohol dehydrogenase family)
MEVNKAYRKVVITGGTRGIGRALAEAFLTRGCTVTITSRQQAALDSALAEIRERFPQASVFGTICDVRQYTQLEMLWAYAEKQMGGIDIWINNAGISNPMANFWELDADAYADVVTTNLVGAMYGSKVALNGFIRQGHGALYNLEGLGSKDNRKVKGQSIYGTTKAALYYLDQAVAAELESSDVIIGALQPGMVLTDMVMSRYRENPEEWKKVKGILTTLSEDVDKVADNLAEKILQNRKQGARLVYSSPVKLMVKMMRMMLVKKDSNE